MKEFLLVFRSDLASGQSQPSPEQMQAIMKQWQDWIGGLAAQDKLANPGNRLDNDGRVVKPGKVITNGPYVETKEAIGGYIIIKANSIDEAAELSKGCPVLAVNGNVEVRSVISI